VKNLGSARSILSILCTDDCERKCPRCATSNAITPTPTISKLPHMPTMNTFVEDVMLNAPPDPLSCVSPSSVCITVVCSTVVAGPTDDEVLVDDDDVDVVDDVDEDAGSAPCTPVLIVVCGRERVVGPSTGVLDVESSALYGTGVLLLDSVSAI
jgi:hypothetical protein